MACDQVKLRAAVKTSVVFQTHVLEFTRFVVKRYISKRFAASQVLVSESGEQPGMRQLRMCR